MFLAPEFPNQNLRQIGPGVPALSLDELTDRHTDITTLLRYPFVHWTSRMFVSMQEEMLFAENIIFICTVCCVLYIQYYCNRGPNLMNLSYVTELPTAARFKFEPLIKNY